MTVRRRKRPAHRSRKSTAPERKKSSVSFQILSDTLRGAPSTPQFDLGSFQSIIEASVWVFAAVYRLAAALASTGYKIVEVGTEHEATGKGVDRLNTLLRDINPDATYYDFLEGWFVTVGINGEVYVEMARNRLGEVAELHLLNPSHVDIVPDPTGRRLAKAYQFRIGMRQVEIPAEDVIACRIFNPRNPYRGFSPIAPIRREVAADIQACLYNLNLLRKGARMSGFLEAEAEMGDLDEPGWARLRESVRQANQGAENAGDVLALPQGFTFKEAGQSLKDMDFIQLRKYAREAVAAAIGVAPMMIQNFDSATYANSEQQLRAFWDYTGKPMLRKLFSAMNEYLVHPEIDAKISILPDIAGIDAQIDSEKSRVETSTKLLTGGVITINEARARVGYPPVPDGHRFLIQGALVPMEVGEIENPLVPREAGMARFGMPAEKNGKGAARLAKSRTKDGDDILREIHGKGLAEAEVAFARRIEAALLAQRRRIAERAVTFGAHATAGDLFGNVEDEDRRLFKAIAPAALEVIVSAGRAVLRRLGRTTRAPGGGWSRLAQSFPSQTKDDPTVSGGAFSLGNLRILEFIETHLFRHVRMMNEFSRERLAVVIDKFREGLERGEGVSELVNRIEAMEEFGGRRAEVIARTETISAVNLGQHEAFVEAGTPRKSWLTSGIERTRLTHLKAEALTNAQPIKTEEPFHLDGADEDPPRNEIAEPMFPGDPSAPGWAAIQCRCALVPEGEEERAWYVERCKAELQGVTVDG